jgi:hypothetical protein
LCSFLDWFFFNFIIQQYTVLILISMRLSQSHDLSCVFDKLTRIDLNHFFIYFLWGYPGLGSRSWVLWINPCWLGLFYFLNSFLNFIFQYWVDYKIDFIIYFNLLSIRLFWSHEPGCEFNKLTLVVFMSFFLLIFFLILSFSIWVY